MAGQEDAGMVECSANVFLALESIDCDSEGVQFDKRNTFVERIVNMSTRRLVACKDLAM